jgi:hypothetical protein
MLSAQKRRRVCQSCIDIDKQIEKHRKLLEATSDHDEIERISQLIVRLYGERVRKHQNPQKSRCRLSPFGFPDF